MSVNHPSNPSSQSKMPQKFDQMGFRQGPGPMHGGGPKVRSKDALGTLRRIGAYLRLERRALSIVILCTVLTTGLALVGPYMIGKLFDEYIVPGHFDGMIRMGLILFGVYALGAFFTWVQQFMASSLSQNTVQHMRQDLFEQYQRMPAGKITVINLLTRFYEIQSGRILIDGEDIRDFDKRELREQIGLVLQDAYVFSGTIRDNIRYGRLDATDQEVETAARLANADTFIRKLPGGYDTELNAEGGNLSQGQRQLLTIAQAILANPSILILDEATSNVDTRTELHIQEAMRTLMQGRTSFVIAYRLSTIREADAILVVQDGRIKEQGTHEELMEQQGFYFEMYQNQFVQGTAS
jgi:ABC-type multidrug transport system fused ATPase/permease subunit